MEKRTVGLIVNLAGIAVLFIALAADSLGLGAVTGIGWKQWTAAAVGVVAAVVGIWLTWTAAKGSK